MKVLHMHNSYSSVMPSGENAVVLEEAEALERAGVAVLRYHRSSDEISSLPLAQRLSLPLRPLWSREDTANVRKIIDRDRPDVLHLHNPNPLLSLAVVRTAARQAVPVVMTVHNHRHTCMAGSFFRDGRPCHECRLHLGPVPGVAHGCYRDSRAQSAAMAVAQVSHRSTYSLVSRFLATSSTIRDSLLSTGLVAPNSVVVKPNSVRDPGAVRPAASGPLRLLFLGRLDEAKGVRLLLDAWRSRRAHLDGNLLIAGTGPLDSLVRAAAEGQHDVTWLGQLDRERVSEAVQNSHVVAVPSLVEEAFGLVAVEAYAHVRPVISTGLGGLADLLPSEAAWTVPPHSKEWAAALDAITVEGAARRGVAGRFFYEAHFTPEKVLSQLLDIYNRVAASRE